MHDIMFSKEIVRVINEKRREIPKGTSIAVAHVALSPLCHVTAKTLSEAFKQMVSGTDLEGISLDIKPLPVKMKCSGCNGIFTVMKPTFSCTICGNPDITIDDNSEFRVESLEVGEG